uniref:ADP-ribosyltransferase exoenzyme n=1 Tax=Pithovirus LCPAC404 TaxID=2506597 RepID=A0A481ZHH4_9VIRU|nr:MAG: ADP-ribosyltransferase exoenzyme [Pithovirus LCPAC404]
MDIKTLCKQVDDIVVTRQNIEKNEAYVKSLNDNVKDIIQIYIGTSELSLNVLNRIKYNTYRKINKGLRSIRHDPSSDIIPSLDGINLHYLYDAIHDAPPNDRSFYVFRATNNFDLDNGKTLEDLKVGDTFYDQSFSSTSWRSRSTEGYSIILIIKIPKELKVIFVEPLSGYYEFEVLSYPGMEFEITDVSVRHYYDFNPDSESDDNLMGFVNVKVMTLKIIGNFWNSAWNPDQI